MKTIYFVMDIESEGVNFFSWDEGADAEERAMNTLDEMRATVSEDDFCLGTAVVTDDYQGEFIPPFETILDRDWLCGLYGKWLDAQEARGRPLPKESADETILHVGSRGCDDMYDCLPRDQWDDVDHEQAAWLTWFIQTWERMESAESEIRNHQV